MKKMKLIIVLAILSIGRLSAQGDGIQGFGSESPWENVDQGAENMDKSAIKQANEGKKANNRGGQGGGGGFASFNTNTKDVPIDSGIVFVIVFFIGFGIYQIRKRKPIAIQS
jgi:hypothetical protein